MKIYEIGTGYTPIPAQMGAATEIVVEELTRSFLKLNQNVEIIDIADENRVKNDLPIIEVKVPSVFTKSDVSLGIMHKLKRVTYSVALAQKLKKILKNTNEETVLHFHNQYNLFFFLKLVPEKYRKKAKIVYTVHSYIWGTEWEQIKEIVKKRYFQEVFCVKNADAVFVLNDMTQHNLVEKIGVEKSKTLLINNGVNTAVYSPIEDKTNTEIINKYGLKDKKVFIQVGSVCERKNQLTAIKMLSPMMKQDKSIVFCYAGAVISQEYQETIAEYSKANNINDQVIYCGELTPGKQLNDFYNMGLAMICPTTAEGFSLVILEAMSAGVPVLINEQLKFALSKKCLRYKDSEEFANIISNHILSKADRNALSKNVREVILSEYSWDEIARQYILSFEKH